METLKTEFKCEPRKSAVKEAIASIDPDGKRIGLALWLEGGNGRFTNRTCLLYPSTLPKEASSQDHKITMALLAHTV